MIQPEVNEVWQCYDKKPSGFVLTRVILILERYTRKGVNERGPYKVLVLCDSLASRQNGKVVKPFFIYHKSAVQYWEKLV